MGEGNFPIVFATFSHHDFKVWVVNKRTFQVFKEADLHSVSTVHHKRQIQMKALPHSQVSGSWSSSASPLSLVNSHGDNKRSKYSCLERWQVLPWTCHKIQHKLCQHRARAEIRTSAGFPPAGARDHRTASCCPTSWTSCHPVQGICLCPWLWPAEQSHPPRHEH